MTASMKGLVYQGTRIRDRDEQLCLTDMWQAAGADVSKRPVEWLRSAAAEQFIDYLAGELEVGNSHLYTTERGGRGTGGATWAHWQIGMAYAKYLDPAFHAWCNEVVRSHMEIVHKGRDFPAVETFGKVFDQKLATVHKKLDRTHAVVEGTDGKVVQLLDAAGRIEKRVNDAIPRKDPTEKTRRIHLLTIRDRFLGLCPCGCRQPIVDNDANILCDEKGQPLAVPDHWRSRERNGIDAVWWVHRTCNQKLRDDDYRQSKHSRFVVFHEERKAVQCRFQNQFSQTRKRSKTMRHPSQFELFKKK